MRLHPLLIIPSLIITVLAVTGGWVLAAQTGMTFIPFLVAVYQIVLLTYLFGVMNLKRSETR